MHQAFTSRINDMFDSWWYHSSFHWPCPLMRQGFSSLRGIVQIADKHSECRALVEPKQARNALSRKMAIFANGNLAERRFTNIYETYTHFHGRLPRAVARGHNACRRCGRVRHRRAVDRERLAPHLRHRGHA